MLAAIVGFAAVWGPVLLGSQYMVGGDVLYGLPPWQALPGAHRASNPLLVDPVSQFLPWLDVTRTALSHGRLPLWDPYALAGKPLLANDQSAVFSPFTLLAAIPGGGWGLSLAMLAKLWVAGLGAAVFVRLGGAGAVGAGIAGISYATSSFLVVWLGWPQTAVAAWLPWAFAAVEWTFRRPSTRAAAAVAGAVALQFFAGHVETSIHLAWGLGVYTLARAALQGWAGIRALGWVAAGAAVGTIAAGIQLLPFLSELSRSSLLAARAHSQAGAGHLPLTAIGSWLVPNLYGNPALDGLQGRAPNYNEATGYAGAAAAVLAVIGLARTWVAQRPFAVSLAAAGLAAAGIAYGPLSPLAARLPLLAVSNNARATVVVCFVVAVLAGLGADGVARTAAARRRAATFAAGAGMLGLAGVAAAAFALVARGGVVERAVPEWHGRIVFWVLVAGFAVVSSAAFAAAGMLGRSRLAGAGLMAVVLLDAGIFAAPYEPRTRPSEDPPRTPVAAWLRAHSAARIAATGLDFFPETSTLYGIADVRGVDTILPARAGIYWRAADPGYDDSFLYTILHRPGAAWLAAAGVDYTLTSDEPLPGTLPVERAGGETIAAVPGARPFAFVASRTETVSTPEAAAAGMAADPLGPVFVEGRCCATSGGGDATVTSRDSQRIEVVVDASQPAVLIVLESYSPAWSARVDGRRAEVAPADVMFQAVPVPAGRHTVVLAYDPPALRWGALASLAGLLAMAALAFVRR